MADIVFNCAKGRVAELAALGAASDALILVPLESSGLVSDATMRDYDDLATLLAGASNEQTSNLTRKTLSSVTVTVDDTNDRVDVDAADVTFTAATGNAVGAVVICYDGDTGAGTDSNIVPLVKLDCTFTPAGGDVTLQFASAGFFRAS